MASGSLWPFCFCSPRRFHDLQKSARRGWSFSSERRFAAYGGLSPRFNYIIGRRSGTAKAANGAAGLPIVGVGRLDGAGAVEAEVVGVGAVRVRSR